MSRIITPTRKLWTPRQKQGGFIINPYRFGSGGAPIDPYWPNVKSLLNFGGADGSTVFTDSTGLRSWAAHGAAEIDTSLGYNAGLFPGGDSDYIETAEDSTSLSFAGQFTLEVIVRISSMTLAGVFANGASSFSGSACAMILNHATQPNKVSFWERSTTPSVAIVASNTLSTGVDYHIEIGRDNIGNVRLHQDGVLATSKSSVTGNIALSALGLRIGRYWGGSASIFVIGWRVTAGVCRHPSDSSFIPPTPPFPTS